MTKKTTAIVPSQFGLAASALVFSITLYGSLTGLFGIRFPFAGLTAILVIQAVILVVGRPILASVGSCALSVLMALLGFALAIHLMVRDGLVLPPLGSIGAAVGAGAAVLFLVLGLVGAAGSGIAPSDAAPSTEPEGEMPEAVPPPVPATSIFEEKAPDAPQRADDVETTWTRPEDAGEHHFDFLNAQDAAEGSTPPSGGDPMLDEEATRVVDDVFLKPKPNDDLGSVLEDIARLETEPEEENQALEVREASEETGSEGPSEGVPYDPSREPQIALAPTGSPLIQDEVIYQDSEMLAMAPVRRPRFRVVRAGTGEELRTFHCDAGYSSLDLTGLQALLSRELEGAEPRIVGLIWQDIDQVEVLVEEAEVSPQPESPPASAPQVQAQPAQAGAMRYFIYDRKSFTLAGEYVPEGRFPRLDRLTLHRILPQYDFRTFAIEAIRWVGPSEIRIYVRGEEKGKGAPSAVQKPVADEAGEPRPRKKRPVT